MNRIFTMIGYAFVIMILFRLFLLWWNSPKQKGKRGEKLVAGRLRRGLPDEYRILNDIYLPLPDGTTTQIDHIPRCPYCGGEMTLRKRRSDGKPFYGCKSYPKCRGMVNVE